MKVISLKSVIPSVVLCVTECDFTSASLFSCFMRLWVTGKAAQMSAQQRNGRVSFVALPWEAPAAWGDCPGACLVTSQWD